MNIADAALSLSTDEDLNPLIDRIKDKKVVCIGEFSHGTSECYTWRSRITKRLIEEHGFSFVAVEGDWPACYDLNRAVKGYSQEGVLDALEYFQRWPTWMWANWEVLGFARWLMEHNKSAASIGFYGLDIYSLFESLEAVLEYLRNNDTESWS